MTTTFEKYSGTRAGNYCTNPKVDVEILPDAHHCERCDLPIHYVRDPRSSWFGEWQHADSALVCDRATPKIWCRYCHAEAPAVEFKFQAWSDETRCDRCGGVDGRAIGD